MATQFVETPQVAGPERSARGVAALTVAATVLVPLAILFSTGVGVPSWLPLALSLAATGVGVLLAGAGVFLVTRSTAAFAGVCAIALGEALALNSPGLLIGAGALIAVNAIWFPLAESRASRTLVASAA